MDKADTEALKALAKMIRVGNEGDWNDGWRAATIIKARQALPALERMLASQTQDMVLVPREPTDDMLDALRGWGEGPLPAKLRWEKAIRIAADTFLVAAAPVASQMGEPAAGMDVWQCAEDICAYLMRELGHDTDNIDRDEIAAIIRKYS